MKLAEALILRADTKKRFEQLRQRLINNAKVQEGDEPAEKPEGLLKEIEQTAAEFENFHPIKFLDIHIQTKIRGNYL